MFDTTQVLALLAGFQVKHYLGDFQFQTTAMVARKGDYLNRFGLLHAAIHAALTLILLLLFGFGLWLATPLALIEMALHYHIDWGKDALTRRAGLTPETPLFWKAVGLDQVLHQLTYIAMVALLVRLIP